MALDAKLASFFPLETVNDVRKLFAYECQKEPNLVLLSIVAGSIENAMTKINDVNLEQPSMHKSQADPDAVQDDFVTGANLKIEPRVNWHQVEALYNKFESMIRSYCDPNLLKNAQESEGQVRKLIKHVADIIWNTLSKAQYKDRPHLQSIYSYLTGSKLDCFGVALTVVAACQMLQVARVHLALSEDHAWVVFGQNGTETAEVTWHGKGSEDKRGQSVEIIKAKTSWLYVAGQPVVCDRHMEVAALVSSINPAINANYDSIEVGGLQQELLWLLYDHGYLKQYPMALGNLGDLEEISPSVGRPPCYKLFEEAINVNRRIYNNHHVYPYTYMAGYHYRVKDYPKALETWANAADVIQLYSYSKDDEEIYKEFMEIANELIPHVVKSEDPKVHNDPLNFAHILRFYDGICRWEEGSATPIMHIGWAKPMVSTCSKFDCSIRRQVELLENTGDDQVILNNNYKYEKYANFCDEESADENSKTSLEDASSSDCAKDPIIALLSEYCHSKVLNIDYLLGQSTQPFTDSKQPYVKASKRNLKTPTLLSGGGSSTSTSSPTATSKISLKLKSAKMLGLKDLLCADRLNTNAIQLQLTALSSSLSSSTASTDHHEDSPLGGSGRPKRLRRE